MAPKGEFYRLPEIAVDEVVYPDLSPSVEGKGATRYIGKIPIHEFAAVVELTTHSAAIVWMAIWHQTKIRRARGPISFCPRAAADFGISSGWTVYRALTALEAAGLVRVERKRGRCPVVEMIVK